MVKVGFIVEGTSDFIILKSERFHDFLKHYLSIESSEEFIIIAGNKSNLKKHFKSYLSKLNKRVQYIFILVDQDDKEVQRRNNKYKPLDCPIKVVEEIKRHGDNGHYVKDNLIFVVMKREMEAWFLADSNLNFKFDGQPDEILNPSKLIEIQLGTSSHVKIANKIMDGFSLPRAAENSPSAKRFLLKLTQISLT